MGREDKSKLEKKVEEGLYGEPEFKKEEKNRFLGEFEERVIRYLDYDQVVEPGTYPQILEAIKHPQAKKLIIDRKVEDERSRDYIELARENNIKFKRVDSPEFKGDIALVVVGEEAVDVNKREVSNRKERLQEQGISDKIIENAGRKLCADCWQELKEKAPQELINYKKMSWMDKLGGTSCVCKEK